MVGHHYASPYCGAKAAILGLTKAWAKELAPWNIHVNSIAPGGVLTNMVMQQPNIEQRLSEKITSVPLHRYAEPREISYAVAFLASDEADFITGQVISPNGGEVIVGAGPRYRVSPTGASRILVLTHIRAGVSVGPSLMPL